MNNIELKKIRALSGFTQAQMAEKLGVTTRTIQKWESGDTIPDSKNLLIKELFKKEESENYINEDSAEYIVYSDLAKKIIENEKKLMAVPLFKLWVENKSQERAIKILKDISSNQQGK